MLDSILLKRTLLAAWISVGALGSLPSALAASCLQENANVDERNASFEVERFAREKLEAAESDLIFVVVEEKSRKQLAFAQVATDGTAYVQLPSSLLSKVSGGTAVRVYKKHPSSVYLVPTAKDKLATGFDPARDCVAAFEKGRVVPASTVNGVACETVDLKDVTTATAIIAKGAEACGKFVSYAKTLKETGKPSHSQIQDLKTAQADIDALFEADSADARRAPAGEKTSTPEKPAPFSSEKAPPSPAPEKGKK